MSETNVLQKTNKLIFTQFISTCGLVH